jgi:hypothetical protein
VPPQRRKSPTILEQPRVAIAVSPRPIVRTLLGIVVALAIASILVNLSRYELGHYSLFGVVDLFSADDEGSVPTWFNALLLLLAAVLLAVIAAGTRSRGLAQVRQWAGLSGVLLFLSIDEIAQIHEEFDSQDMVDMPGPFEWVFVGAVAVVAFSLVFARFVRDLPPETRARFAFAGALYVFGGLGLEFASSLYAEANEREGMGWALLTTTEELVEMLALVVFVAALFTYVQAHFPRVSFEFEGSAAPEPELPELANVAADDRA